MKKFHYCYKITNLKPVNEAIYYIGVRTSKVKPEDDINYYGSSKYLKHSLEEIGYHNFKKEILSVWETREEANNEEIRLHQLYNVAQNPNFYNKSKAASNGFCTLGMVSVINLKTGTIEFVSLNESKDKSKYKSLYDDVVNATNRNTGEKVKVTKEEFKNNPNLKHTVKGTVTVIDTETGIRKQVSVDEFNNNPKLVGQLKGMVNCVDTRTGDGCSVTKEEFAACEFYSHCTKNTVVVYDTVGEIFKRVSLEEYEQHNCYISQKSRLVEIYDENDVLQYSVFNKFKDFCKLHKLPFNAFSVSKQNNGQPLYYNSGSNEARLKKENYWKFKGWYAVNKKNIFSN